MRYKLLFFLVISLSMVKLFSQEVNKKVQPKVGLVLSGGGAKGFAHIGVLKVLEQTGVKIDYIAGTSMGAVVGGLYAANYSAKEIDSIINSIDFVTLLQDKIPRKQAAFFEKQYGEKHLISFPVTNKGKITLPSAIAPGQSVYNELNALFEHVHDVTDFNDLPIPFFCMTTDLETGESVLLNKGHLPEAVRASASLPTLLQPIEIDGRSYIDGGVANNFPVDEMIARGANIIIGVDVQGKLEEKENINSVVDVLNQIVNFQMYAGDDKKVKKLTVHVKPDTRDLSITSFDKTVEIIAEGQRIAGELQKKIAKSILFTDVQTLDGRHSGRYISNIQFDTGQVSHFVSTGILNLMKDSFSVVFLVGLMFYQNWKLASFAIIMIPLAGGLAKNLGKQVAKATTQASKLSGNLIAYLADILRSSRMIRIFQKEDLDPDSLIILVLGISSVFKPLSLVAYFQSWATSLKWMVRSQSLRLS